MDFSWFDQAMDGYVVSQAIIGMSFLAMLVVGIVVAGVLSWRVSGLAARSTASEIAKKE